MSIAAVTPFLQLVADRKSFLLRIDPAVLDAVQRWANDDLRSLNGQIEWILRWALQEARRGKIKHPQDAAVELPPPEKG